MRWAQYRRLPKIAFRTPAPPGAPEVRGYRAYFQPEELEWTVTASRVSVYATGQATRAKDLRGGDRSWEMFPEDERPEWLRQLPEDVLTMLEAARAGVGHLTALAHRLPWEGHRD